MRHIIFDKAIAEEFLECVKHGKPIPCPPGGWNGDSMLRLAGMLYWLVYDAGPQGYEHWDWSRAHAESREAVVLQHHKELDWAIEVYAEFTKGVCNGTYDSNGGEPVYEAKLTIEDGKPTIRKVRGSKSQQECVQQVPILIGPETLSTPAATQLAGLLARLKSDQPPSPEDIAHLLVQILQQAKRHEPPDRRPE